MKIGLALGGGAAYGLAHIGIIKALEENGIKPACIAGTSVGALIGSLYASGCTVAEMEAAARDFDWIKTVKFTLPKGGLISFERLDEFMLRHAKSVNIEDTKVPLAIIASNLLDGKVEVMRRGPIAISVRASCGLPGIFTPTSYNNKLFVDGGVLNNVPTDVVKSMGADMVIGIDTLAKSQMDMLKHTDMFSVVWQSWAIAIQQYLRTISYKDADIVLMPDIHDIMPFDIYKREIIMQRGYETALRDMPEILELIKKKSSFVGKIKEMFK